MRHCPPQESPITQLLHRWRSGSDEAFAELVSQVTEELRRIAAVQMRGEPASHTLQPTALVNELFLRLADKSSVTWRNRAHFFGTAARMMRRILIDHARRKKAQKRGGDAEVVLLRPGVDAPQPAVEIDLLALDQALDRLRSLDPDQARIVELRFFAGLTIEEVAGVLAVSPSTVSRSWQSARTWLYGELRSQRGTA